MTEEQKYLESWPPDYTNEKGEQFYEKGKVAIMLSEHAQSKNPKTSLIFPCRFCDCSFADEYDLEAHVSRKHNQFSEKP